VEIRATAADPGRVQDLRWEFWVILAAGSKNIAYRLLFNTLHELYHKGRGVMEAALGSEFDHSAHLEEIQQAVERRDEAAAERAALAQIRPVSEALLKAIDGVRP
jgi:DNA-binding FadR family transcriptional regulator